ncbi:tRNA (adenosine(37)-N6)-threonylcarbamoyltransferase complex dimerization subunit type 1 TsaB [Curvivirga aplysinae]|uniref:tRNA (adenosine(37)-N6)-threonylcarbamoyltransferase complex dimerization subunit type 1 TsaB n=1 Tax=Curvivirga aplysinae TaxID=2529852 RepID=UPI0012BD5E31|nr:tRNA (adenosine(37)-N6)-threonylcarbamoyltransferase complex dimerization subunit type 1 TsaB [Curvivirga aplysinae]
MTLLLALDSACASCSAAVWQDGEVLAHKFEDMPRGQSENLMPFVAEVMKKSSIDFPDLDVLAVTVGPGAFTGIRICLSAARGLALATKKPLVGVTTMEALLVAQDLSNFQGALVAVVIETKRMDYYIQFFDHNGMSMGEPEALLASSIAKKFETLSQGKQIFLCGDGAERLKQEAIVADCEFEFGSENSQPDAGVFGQVAMDKYNAMGRAAFEIAPAPLYLRPPDATPPKPKFLFKAAGH